MSLIIMPPKVITGPAWYESNAIFAFDALAGNSNGQSIPTSQQLSRVTGTYMSPVSSNITYSNNHKLNSPFSIYLPPGGTLDLVRPSQASVNQYTNMTWDSMVFVENYDLTESYNMFYRSHNTATDRLTVVSSYHDLDFRLWNNDYTAKLDIASFATRDAWSRQTVIKAGNIIRLLRNGKQIASASYAIQPYTIPSERILAYQCDVYYDRYQMVPSIFDVDYVWLSDLLYNTDLNSGNPTTVETIDVVNSDYGRFYFDVLVTASVEGGNPMKVGIRNPSTGDQLLVILSNGQLQTGGTTSGPFFTSAKTGDTFRFEILNTNAVNIYQNNVLKHTVPAGGYAYGGGTFKPYIYTPSPSAANTIQITKAALTA